jgi:nifR3 family TIM-barrel protein
MTNFYTTLPRPFLAMAPMEGVTDIAFRELVAEIGKPNVMYTEFANVMGLFSEGRNSALEYLRYTDKQRPIVAQIWGTDPEKFRRAAQLLVELGFDGIDINMGCPVAAVVKKKGGAGLIKEPNLAVEIIRAVKEGAPTLPISVKTRVGFDKTITESWISTLLGESLAALTVHGRLAVEMSKKPADWTEVDKAVKLRNALSPATLIIGNGDVESRTQALEYSQKYGVDGVMIGRGIFKNPWLFINENSQEHSPKDYIALLKRHIYYFKKYYGENKNFEILKKFLKVYIKGFDGANEARMQFMQATSLSEIEKGLNELEMSCKVQ